MWIVILTGFRTTWNPEKEKRTVHNLVAVASQLPSGTSRMLTGIPVSPDAYDFQYQTTMCGKGTFSNYSPFVITGYWKLTLLSPHTPKLSPCINHTSMIKNKFWPKRINQERTSRIPWAAMFFWEWVWPEAKGDRFVFPENSSSSFLFGCKFGRHSSQA